VDNPHQHTHTLPLLTALLPPTPPGKLLVYTRSDLDGNEVLCGQKDYEVR